MTTIPIPSGTKYLSNHLTELPSNCIFDKGRVGCGGTTLAIKSNKPYVIAVPFVALIENKAKQHPEILPVFKGVGVKHIKNYVKENGNPVIMTTYDSLDKVMSAINVEEYNLLVDEYHLLFTQYSFREEAVHKVLDNYTKFKEFCFMTATVLEEEFILEELREVSLVRAVWNNVIDVKVNSILCPKNILGNTIDLINNHLNGTIEGNAYLFVNSVTFIKDLIGNIPELNITNCNIIYSKNNKTQLDIDRGELPSTKGAPTKKINLLTSTVFEGSDIYDEEGKTYIISDASKAFTLVDISTSFQQIAGRIRNSKYIGEISHLYTKTRYTNLTYDEFKVKSEDDIVLTKVAVKEFNALSDYTKALFQSKPNETYLSLVDGDFMFNPNLVKLDLYNFKVCKHLYSLRVNILEEELSKYNYDVHNTVNISETVSISTRDLDGFEKTIIELKRIDSLTETSDVDRAFKQIAYEKYPFLEEALTKLGFEGIEEENYVQTNIKRKLTCMLEINQESKIFNLLKSCNDLEPGEFIPSKVLKTRFKEIYKQLGIVVTAKGSDIEAFFSIKEHNKKIKGKVIHGFTILNPKYIISNYN